MNRFASILTLSVAMLCGTVGCGSKPSLTGTWRGTGAQPNMAPYPMVMSITQKGNEITGTINWPTLRNSTTRFTGTIDGTKVRFVETELIEGSGVGIPCTYQGELIGNTIAGTCVYENVQGTFSVTMQSDAQKISPSTVIDERTRIKSAILRVLKADSELCKQYLNFAPNTTASQAAWAVGQYCDVLERLNMSDCPPDFRVAYRHHMRAWRDLQDEVKKLPEDFLEGVFMGAMNSLLRGEIDGGQSRLEGGLNRSRVRVRTTWEDVEKTGAKYGAAI